MEWKEGYIILDGKEKIPIREISVEPKECFRKVTSGRVIPFGKKFSIWKGKIVISENIINIEFIRKLDWAEVADRNRTNRLMKDEFVVYHR